MSESIPLSVPLIAGNEWTYVKECLDTGWVSSVGKYVERFEEDMCKHTGAKFAVACVSGTAALHVALRIAGVNPGDEVIVPTLTFIAPVNAINYLCANPVFMDCDNYYNIDVEKTLEFLSKETIFRNGYTYNRTSGNRIAAIIPVHVFGNAVRLYDLLKICRERRIRIVEDATESLGTYYTEGPLDNKHCGTVGDLGCLSFNGNKMITTGGGGMILTNDEEYAARAKYLSTQAKNDSLYYVHDEVGYNYRLTNVQAAMGVAQLEQLRSRLEIKRRNYSIYKSKIDLVTGLHMSELPEYAVNNCWMYALQVDPSLYGMDRDQLMGYLANHRIETRPVWHLNHLQKPYRHCHHYRIENALRLLETTLNIPCSVSLSEKEINIIVARLKNA